jgi:VanZ family protein
MKVKLLRTINIILFMMILLYGSLAPAPIPGEGKTMPWQVFHNSLHIPAYALLTYLWLLRFGNVTKKRLILAASIAIAYGILIEYLQSFTPGRTPSLMDVGLNTVGVAVVVLISWNRLRAVGRDGVVGN